MSVKLKVHSPNFLSWGLSVLM